MIQLTTQTWFLYFKGFQIWITGDQATEVRKLMDSGKQYIDIDGRRLKLDDVALLKGEDNDRAEKVKRGDWMCTFGQWHERNNECGHGLEYKK